MSDETTYTITTTDSHQAAQFVAAASMAVCLRDLDQEMRTITKHGQLPYRVESAIDMAQHVREWLRDNAPEIVWND